MIKVDKSWFKSFIAGGLGGVMVIVIFSYFGSRYLEELRPDAVTASNPDAAAPQKTAEPLLFSEEALITAAVEKADPAVFSIVVTKDVPIIERYYDFFGPFNFQIPKERERGTEKREIGGGSGFVISTDGLALTNRHVVTDTAADYTALTNDGAKHEVTVVAKDTILDIAVLRIKGGPFTALTLGDSDKIKVGQTAIAIGNALGEFENTVSVGVISGLYRSIVAADDFGAAGQLDEVIQTDAAINPGNSGGPLLDLRGRVIGVNVAVARGSENIGFALPINLIKSVVESVKKNNKIIRPYLGIRYSKITSELKEKNNLPFDYGALVARGETAADLAVIPGSPADKAGIVENDIILEIDGVKLANDKNLSSIIRRQAVGETITLKIFHRGETKIVTVRLETAPE
ncbi:MAG: trypsin-like peptidase domain-containing protein [Candidatus Vogelbacteria bacterium]|nr:trypsin-like peptidase domain-containing protein [Candidatus Vogelbacteria bacterium]